MKSHGKAFLRIGGLASSLRYLLNEYSHVEMVSSFSVLFPRHNDGSTCRGCSYPSPNRILIYVFLGFDLPRLR